jgi:beta-N-acetylglucosaminidase
VIKAMTEKELKSFTINYINQKELENENFIRYTFYELRVKNNLSEDEVDTFLRINRDYFENKGYKVYFTNARFTYNNANMIVQPNELMIAIKEIEEKESKNGRKNK